MTELFEPVGDHDHRLARGADGLLGALNRAGLLEAGDLHVATRVADLAGETGEGADAEPVLLALALAVRAVRHGSVAVDLTRFPDLVRDLVPGLALPEPEAWLAAVARSRLVGSGALRLEHGLLYLDRYHRLEQQVCADLVARAEQPPPPVDEAALAAALDRVGGGRLSDQQRDAADRSVRQWTTVLTGGPGTGKTTTVARILAVLADQAAARGERLSVALSAPTGKAAARLQEAVETELAGLPAEDRDRLLRTSGRGRGLDAMTLHRLLGWRPDNATRFRHDRTNRLTYDVVVVDESSMVELTLMARLLEAVRPQARLLLVGDPRQLTSVGAGAVLSDLVAGHEGDPASPVVSLTENYRSTEDIKTLAEALRTGTADEVLAALRTPSPEVEYVETDDPAGVLRPDALASALAVRRAAERGDAEAAVHALDDHRLLCAHREGPYGVRVWNRTVEQWLAEEIGEDLHHPWYVGRPLLVTTNDHALEVYNGETGAVVLGEDGRVRAWIAGSGGLHDFAPGRLDAVETMHAMTIHKSQGSQARRVTVLLPEEGSRLLSRELFYTAVTRAQQHVRVVGSEAAVRAAVETSAERATGLRQRLQAARAARAAGSGA
ncbi:exodeoxyribonuclease V subunit alpha [Nocardioides sp. zg-579]|uniref:RecBCD enzyme subunit RecD n=1 Tax=Nocardioides marmotae TaxID=2663857 RepID=A0A6I3JDG3_9ACTN|nr:exodeoxyribonuclease V subunit alpha [Nocardioides marmotae]MCR6032508.1 exodeoxyribonuclease V subunit alpha [Gordonia jinghuaiqii]MTB96157.1 exodeoxyribonuclease V subunit alpha [Nocardioides marmotae]QKD99767.1 exodeoxyribonuclease V subunit alpha [Nocardioides marmotae]